MKYFCILILMLSCGCATTKPSPAKFVVEHDSRAKHSEPWPSRVR